jgi:myo-inositol-1(or 4)-monophosphatase
MDMESYLNTAKEAAVKAGMVLTEHSDSPPRVRFKGSVDLVTEYDSLAQRVIFDTIASRFPDHDFLAEEDLCQDKGSSFRWIVDPLDGTTNYAHNYPVFCVSIALTMDKKTTIGVVYDPIREEMFTAVRDRGARLNEKRIRVSEEKELDKSLVATGFPYDLRESSVNNIDHFVNFVTRVQGIRRGGSAALDLCYVACGRFDGFWELKLQPWDVAAGVLIVLESGGRVSDFSGGEFDAFAQETLATNKHIHQQMVDILKKPKESV